MIPQVPYFVSILFMLTTFLTLWFFYKASNSKFAIFILLAWVSIQAIITQSNFYLETSTWPPRFLLLVVPPLLLILYLFFSEQGKIFLDSLDTTWLTYLHVVRVPVEITLYYLFVSSLVPEVMTFEGRNFDILSGLTAPIIAYVGYTQQKLSKTLLLIWNFLCMALLVNIVSTAVLSAPFPFQQLAFDQPNVGVLYFPFSWLPGCVVPLVLFSHLVCVRQLLKK
jgi:hypothetical protein